MRSSPCSRIPRRAAALLACALSIAACGTAADERLPEIDPASPLADAEPLSPALLAALEGLFDEEATPWLGPLAAVRASRSGLTLLGGTNAASALLRAGCVDEGDRLVLEGTWREAAGSGRGMVRLTIEPPALAARLCAGLPAPDPEDEPREPLVLRGTIGHGAAALATPVTLRRRAPLRPAGARFLVVGHRGACRTQDACGASENSLESIRLAEALGAQAVELDVRVTADGVPVLFHDERLTPDLVRGLHCRGPVSAFALADLRDLCRLRFGERIPTVEDALRVIALESRLTTVWLDLKSPAAVAPLARLLTAWAAWLREAAPGLRVVMGLPDEATADEYLRAQVPWIPCLVENDDPRQLDRLGCDVWAPRWTGEALPRALVRSLRRAGKAVFFWTVDDREAIDRALREARPSGIVSNRPGLVFQRAQALEVVAARAGPW